MEENTFIYKENVKRILFRDYVNEEAAMIQIIESVLEKVPLEWYMLQGYSEEATANEIFENVLFCNKDDTGE